MLRYRLSIGASALILMVSASPALAVHTLPKIEVGGVKHRAARVGAPTTTRTVAAPPSQAAPSVAPVSSPGTGGTVGGNPSVPWSPDEARAPLAQPQRPDTASSTRTFSGAQVNAIPFAQPGDALEIVPGLLVAQHSGSGKANQYFLRGFALDHGNDLALWIDGMPINMPSHAHGQGYADANFIIPELFSAVDVRKGPYFADGGIFASAGQINMQYIDKLPEGMLSISGGSFGWARSVVAKSWEVNGGNLIAAVEANHYNGPWEVAENTKKLNSYFRWSQGTQANGFSITGMAYSNHWNATDQIPQRTVDEGLLSRWGTLDPTTHGNSARYSLSTRWSQSDDSSFSKVEGYIIRSELNLWDMSTGILEHPELGDQFQNFDSRNIFGLNATHGWNYNIYGTPMVTRVGLQGRYDDIRNGLSDSFMRNVYDRPRNDYIKEGNVSLWTDTTAFWTPWLRTSVGARFDWVAASVNSIQLPFGSPVFGPGTGGYCFAAPDPENCLAWTGPFNSGSRGQTMGSPKAGMVLGPFNNTELFLNFGEGLQSSDARGTVAVLDPHNGTPFAESGQVLATPLLVKTRGAEAGVRSKALLDGLDTSLSLWWQDFDSENLFEGDEGTTVFGRPSRRYGFEWTGRYTPTNWLSLDGEVSATHARFRGSDLVQRVAYYNILSGGSDADALFPLNVRGNSPGNYLTNAPTVVATGGVEAGEKTGWFGALRYRYFGSRPLTEDGQIRSIAAGTLNLRAGYRFDNGWKAQIDAFNITNNRGDAIAYGYGSFVRQDLLFFQHPGDSIGIMDRHFKPVDPPAVRMTLAGPLAIFDGYLNPRW
jgi:hypothetical protein